MLLYHREGNKDKNNSSQEEKGVHQKESIDEGLVQPSSGIFYSRDGYPSKSVEKFVESSETISVSDDDPNHGQDAHPMNSWKSWLLQLILS